MEKFTERLPNQIKKGVRLCIVVDELCLSPMKTLDQNQQLTTFGNLLWPISVCYLVTFVSNILIVHFRLIQLTQK